MSNQTQRLKSQLSITLCLLSLEVDANAHWFADRLSQSQKNEGAALVDLIDSTVERVDTATDPHAVRNLITVTLNLRTIATAYNRRHDRRADRNCPADIVAVKPLATMSLDSAIA